MIAQRQRIARDTVARSPDITAETPGASASSTFIKDQLPPLSPDSCPHHPPTKVRVVNSDAFTAAREILRRDDTARGKTAVLNLACDEVPAGGWPESLGKTQEEALCYSSTLYATLLPQYYPWPNLGPGSVAGIFSPGVVVFKDDLDHDCVELPVEERVVVSVITVAAPRVPALTGDGQSFANAGDLEDLRGKIRLVYRMAAGNGQDRLVLGAMGCGAYGCPSKQVAEEMKAILLDEEFKGWFREIVFAVYSNQWNGNFSVFQQVFDGVEV
ncbi:hypothetical protein PLICRDRAFT_246234 [Plicaturopsis crispa FD-325 SS-3]|nr:hypothetical protein PLICRDRAFT_246234 [Plicaturopsis crispa FD-325 SS-3]